MMTMNDILVCVALRVAAGRQLVKVQATGNAHDATKRFRVRIGRDVQLQHRMKTLGLCQPSLLLPPPKKTVVRLQAHALLG